jgi:Na+/melibiose symporter-like transporter
MILLSLLAWASELTDDYHQRSRVMGAIQVANLTGTIAVLVIAALSDRATGGDAASRMASMGWTVIVALPVFVAVALWRVPERVPRPGASPDFRATVVAMWRSIALRRLLVCDLIAGLAIGLPSSLVLFFATRTLRLGPESSALVLINAASALVFVPFWIRVAGRVGKDKALLGAALWAIPTGLIYYLLPAESFPLAALAFALGGVNGGALQFLPRAILSDIIDEAEANGGERHEAAYFALLTTTLKAGLALAVGLGLYTLAFIGFDPSGQSTPEAIEGIRYAMIGYPVLFGLAIAGLMYRFPLGREQHERLRAEIGNRRKRSSPAAVHPRR